MNPREQELCNWILNEVIRENAEPDLLAGQLLDLAHSNSTVHLGARNLETFQVQIGHARSEYHQKRVGELLNPVLAWIAYLLVNSEALKDVSESEISEVALEELPEPPEKEIRGTFTIRNGKTAVNVSIDLKNVEFDQHPTLQHV